MDDTTDRVIKGRSGGGALLIILLFMGVAVACFIVAGEITAIKDLSPKIKGFSIGRAIFSLSHCILGSFGETSLGIVS